MADKAPSGIWNSYKKEGDKVVKQNKSCPKCGSGFSLAAHKDRLTCGACNYTEFTKVEKKEEPKKEHKHAPKKDKLVEKKEEPKKEEKPSEDKK